MNLILSWGGLGDNHFTKHKAVLPHMCLHFSTLTGILMYHSIYSRNTFKELLLEEEIDIYIFFFSIVNINTWIQFPDGYVYGSSSVFHIIETEFRIDYDFISLSQTHSHIILEFLSNKLNQNANFRGPMKYIRAECSMLMSNCILESVRKQAKNSNFFSIFC